MEDLNNVFKVHGFILQVATDISEDGTVITGYGVNQQAIVEPWRGVLSSKWKYDLGQRGPDVAATQVTAVQGRPAPLDAAAVDQVFAGMGNGIAGSMPAFYDGGLQTINFKQEPAQAEASLLAHNKSINIIYMSSNPATGQMFTPVINALPAPGEGPGFNPLWQAMDIGFSDQDFAPRQFTSDSAILAAAAAGEITLVPTDMVFRCSVVGRKA
jgi:hypothetical protein